MSNKLSRRQVLSLGVATIVGGTSLWTEQGHGTNPGSSGTAYEPFKGHNPPKSDSRPYWEKSYSGGPVNATPLPPVLPGRGYKPVVVPNGGALPFKIVDGVKVFHLIAEEVDHHFDSGLLAKWCGFNGRV